MCALYRRHHKTLAIFLGDRRPRPLYHRPHMAILDKTLLDLLVCPLTKGPLQYDAEKQELISREAKLAYPIREGIPVMLVDEARKLDA